MVPPLPNATLHSGLSHVVTPSIDQTWHSLVTLLMKWTPLPSLNFLPNFWAVSIEHLQRCGMSSENAYSYGHQLLSNLVLACVLMLRPVSLEVVMTLNFEKSLGTSILLFLYNITRSVLLLCLQERNWHHSKTLFLLKADCWTLGGVITNTVLVTYFTQHGYDGSTTLMTQNLTMIVRWTRHWIPGNLGYIVDTIDIWSPRCYRCSQQKSFLPTLFRFIFKFSPQFLVLHVKIMLKHIHVDHNYQKKIWTQQFFKHFNVQFWENWHHYNRCEDAERCSVMLLIVRCSLYWMPRKPSWS